MRVGRIWRKEKEMLGTEDSTNLFQIDEKFDLLIFLWITLIVRNIFLTLALLIHERINQF